MPHIRIYIIDYVTGGGTRVTSGSWHPPPTKHRRAAVIWFIVVYLTNINRFWATAPRFERVSTWFIPKKHVFWGKIWRCSWVFGYSMDFWKICWFSSQDEKCCTIPKSARITLTHAGMDSWVFFWHRTVIWAKTQKIRWEPQFSFYFPLWNRARFIQISVKITIFRPIT